jgi:altronate dehydratase large subunit
MEFMGFRRKDGRTGIRNHVLVVSSVSCASGVVEAIGRALPEVVTIVHAYGCGYGGEDAAGSFRVLSGLANGPNVGAALFVGLGCEGLTAGRLAEAVGGKPVESLVIQKDGGSAATTAKGIEIATRLLRELKQQERTPAPVSELVVGLECGGSDAFSGIAANPAVGVAADRLVSEGATVILSETTEMIGTAHILGRRGATPELGREVEQLVNDHEKKVRDALGELAGLVIAPGNMEGGLSSIAEKSLGCIAKGGSSPITEVIGYARPPSKQGLVIMDTPGYDIDSMAGMAGGGAQMIIFTTGRGTPAGFPAIPVIKVASNSEMYGNMPGDLDVNAGTIVDGEATLEQVGAEIYGLALRVAAGEQTCAETNRSRPFGYLKQGPTF